MPEPLVIETGWPAPILSPNASHQRDIWNRKRAKTAAKNEAYLATCEALNPARTGPWGKGPPLGPGPFKLTIHAHPPTRRFRDDDNLVAQCKAALDGIALRLKVDDRQFKLQPVQWYEAGPANHPTGKAGGLFFEVEVAHE